MVTSVKRDFCSRAPYALFLLYKNYIKRVILNRMCRLLYTANNYSLKEKKHTRIVRVLKTWKNNKEKLAKRNGEKGKKRSDKLVECVANSLLDLKPHVAHRHIFPE